MTYYFSFSLDDQNRVKLRGVAADYINACYLDVRITSFQF